MSNAHRYSAKHKERVAAQPADDLHRRVNWALGYDDATDVDDVSGCHYRWEV